MADVSSNDLPDSLRVKLSEAGEKRIWDAVEQQSGISAVADDTGYSRSKLYNWKHKTAFFPVKFVRQVLDAPEEYVKAIKGGGRSHPIPVELPLHVSEELLTRTGCSVHVNSQGVPTYQTQEASLVNRFVRLLQELGDVSVSVYHRSAYEVRYPAYLQELFASLSYESDTGARIDEVGSIEGEQIVLPEKTIGVQEFDGTLHHRGKKLQLALARGDSTTIAQLMAAEAEKVEHLVDR